MINKHLSSYPSFSNEADIFLDKNVKAECMTSVLQCVLAYIQGLFDAIFGFTSHSRAPAASVTEPWSFIVWYAVKKSMLWIVKNKPQIVITLFCSF